MSVEMKLGRWEARSGDVFNVSRHTPGRVYEWEADNGMRWTGDGAYWAHWHYDTPCQDDLVRYLGPVELSPTPACAEAGPAGDPQTVSTEDPQESLKRMKRLEATIHRELEIYLPLVAGLKTTASDLDEAIKMLEREVEG